MGTCPSAVARRPPVEWRPVAPARAPRRSTGQEDSRPCWEGADDDNRVPATTTGPAPRLRLAGGPHIRWSFLHLREVVPTVPVRRGSAPPVPLPIGTLYDPTLRVARIDGRTTTVAKVLADTYTDGFLAMHRGQMIAEQYFNGMSANHNHLLMSVSKSLIGCVVAILADRGRLTSAFALRLSSADSAVGKSSLPHHPPR